MRIPLGCRNQYRNTMPATDSFDPRPFHDFELAGWERAAAWYARSFGELTAQTAEPVLDIACGPGFIAAAAAARHAVVVGLDFSTAMVAEATRRYPAVQFQEGDAEALPFDAGSFDVVVMNFGMLHLSRPDTAIGEAHRVLRRGGRYAFTVWAAPEQAIGFGMVMAAIEAHGRRDVPLPEGPPFFRFSSTEECRRTLERAQFADVSVQVVPIAWRVIAADEVFEAMTKGGVRTAAVLRAQTPDALAAIRDAVRRTTESYATPEGYVLPMPAVLAVGTRR
jgi:ubiquinone/menaquinone biosynthesis C-methylase UbiE